MILLLPMLHHVVVASKHLPASGADALLTGNAACLGIRFVLNPVVSVHIPGLGCAVLAILGCLAAYREVVLSFDMFAKHLRGQVSWENLCEHSLFTDMNLERSTSDRNLTRGKAHLSSR